MTSLRTLLFVIFLINVSTDHIYFSSLFNVYWLVFLEHVNRCGIPYGLAVRIPGFHPGGLGSTPGMGTRFLSEQTFQVLFLVFIKHWGELSWIYQSEIFFNNSILRQLFNGLRVGFRRKYNSNRLKISPTIYLARFIKLLWMSISTATFKYLNSQYLEHRIQLKVSKYIRFLLGTTVFASNSSQNKTSDNIT